MCSYLNVSLKKSKNFSSSVDLATFRVLDCHMVATLLDKAGLQHFCHYKKYCWTAQFHVIRLLGLCGLSDHFGSLRYNQNWYNVTDPYNSGMKSRELENRELGSICIDVRMGLPKERSKGPHKRNQSREKRRGKNLNSIIWWFTCKYILFFHAKY